MNVNKKKLRKVLYVYIAIIIVLIFSSKTIYNMSVPKVTVVMPQGGRLTKELEARGTVEFERTYNVYAPFGGQLETLSVRKGDAVRPHMELVQYVINSTDADVDIDWGFTVRRIRAKAAGTVTALYAGDGQFVVKGEKIAAIGVNNNRFTVIISCDASKGSFINIGDEADIYLNGSNPAAVGAVREITAEGERLNITLTFESETFTGGEYITARFSKQTETYDILVPNEAVVSEGVSSFVWTIQSKNGALGAEYFTVKTRVFIADSDDFYTAISRGMEYPAPVVVSFDRDLAVNGRVNRLE
jgi:multidrug efflux pump subunit AcrA (membrane-fusion protein)